MKKSSSALRASSSPKGECKQAVREVISEIAYNIFIVILCGTLIGLLGYFIYWNGKQAVRKCLWADTPSSLQREVIKRDCGDDYACFDRKYDKKMYENLASCVTDATK